MARPRPPRMLDFGVIGWLVCLSLIYAPQVWAGDAVLSWDPNPETDLGGYKVYYGTTSGIYGASLTVGNVTTSTVGGLGPGTYYFVVTAYNTSGNESGLSSEVSKTIVDTSSAGAADTTPPGDVIGLTAKPHNRMVALSWTNPADLDFAGVVLRYRTDGTYPLTETDGSPVGDFPGLPNAFVKTNHTGLQNKVTYYYSAFTYDTTGNYSRTSHAFAMPEEGLGGSIDAPSGGCGMIRPDDGNRPGPWQAADMVALLGLLLIRLAKRFVDRVRDVRPVSALERLGA